MREPLDPFWPIVDGFFVFPPELEVIRSPFGRHLQACVGSIDDGLSVYLRGSQLECCTPFPNSDVDLVVRYKCPRELVTLQSLLPAGKDYDIKIFRMDEPVRDPVTRALLECRALQLCGAPRRRRSVAADKRFAWDHWLAYGPAMRSSRIQTTSRWALLEFKLLVRSFGVLSFLRDRRFTRDISACLRWAVMEDVGVGDTLVDCRRALESGEAREFDMRPAKQSLYTGFDRWIDRW